MELMKRWQLKLSAQEQLRGKWGMMALKTFLITVIPVAGMMVLWMFFAFSSLFAGIFFQLTSAGIQRGGLHSNWVGMGWPVFMLILLVVIYIAVIIVMLALDFGFTDGCIKLRSGEDTGVGVIFGKFGMLPKIIKLLLLYLPLFVPYFAVCILASVYRNPITTLLAWVVLVCYIYLVIRLSMSVYILLENPYTTPWTAIKQSFYMMRGHCWRYFILSLSFLGWYCIALLTFGVGFFWLIPYMRMTFVNFYYDLKQHLLSEQSMQL